MKGFAQKTFLTLEPREGDFQISHRIKLWEYENLFRELVEPNSSDSHFSGSSISSPKLVMKSTL